MESQRFNWLAQKSSWNDWGREHNPSRQVDCKTDKREEQTDEEGGEEEDDMNELEE